MNGWKVTSLVLLGMLFGVLLTLAVRPASAAGDSVIRASRFELVDSSGRLRGLMFVTRDGTAKIGLTDSLGDERVGLSASGESGAGAVAIFDAAAAGGKVRALYSEGAAGSFGLSLWDRKDREVITLGVTSDGQVVKRP